ncbi:alpha/beta hydrolase [Aureivirga sp. CE67]|uniref:alpha/beta hydrolase n=1 Tax=Aureivirga sp. CE67 TaxID=1788983 RepID=UPI0018CA762C|nr:alpha/beta hydrolase [Aureivirga sp. CE67]
MSNIKKLFLVFAAIIMFSCNTSTEKGKTEINKETVEKKNSQTIKFPSSDGIEITGNLYMTKNKENPFILLFHQAGYSRGEYLEIAPKLNALGYNCLAIDQRSGKEINGVKNETHLAAEKAGKATEYPDALQDAQAAINYIEKEFKPKQLIIWGSSYSASLTFILGAMDKNVDAILAFSPGEYFKYNGKSIADYASEVTVPVFITSARNEEKNWKSIYVAIPTKDKVGFIPKGKGVHGSKALWQTQPDHREYWAAVESFLKSIRE